MAPADSEPDGPSGRCILSPNMMKLVTLVTLLVSDFDIVFTLFCIILFVMSGNQLALLFAGTLGFFFLIYTAFCCYAASEASKFIDRFKAKVRVHHEMYMHGPLFCVSTAHVPAQHTSPDH